MDDITRLKKQVKLLGIGLITLGILSVGMLINSVARLTTTEAWPELRLGKLAVKELRIISPDGQPKMILYTNNNAPVVALMDQAAELRMLLSATTKEGASLAMVDPKKINNVYFTSGFLQMGEEAQTSLRLVAPSDGGPRLVFRDENGYGITIGRTGLLDKQSGTQSFTSAASIVVSSKEATVNLPLLKPAAKPK